MRNVVSEMMFNYEAELKELEYQISDLRINPNLTANVLSGMKNLRRRNELPKEVLELLHRKADLEVTIMRLKYILETAYEFVTESASEGPVDVGSHVVENFTDVVGADIDRELSGVSSVPMSYKHKLALDDFFSRPISIADFEEKVGGTFSDRLDVWHLYSAAPSVRAKLRNYSFLKANLMVMINISGTPFHYGKALVSYQPYPDANDCISGLTGAAALRPQLLTYLSQAPGAVTIDYNGNRPVLVKCPFISVKPMHRLYNTANTVISAATPFVDLGYAGSIYFYSINAVAAATATPSSIGVHVYAWLEDIELGPPTGTQIEITTESGDERKSGPVERISSALVKVSDALGVIPQIAPFARASSMFFGGLNHLAAVFGWSRPLVEDKANFVKNRPFTNAAFGITSDTSEKVSLDPMQELTVDPRVCGVVDDELNINYMCGIQSYLTTFSWTDTDAVGTPIWACIVHPQLESYNLATTPDIYQPTAMSFAVTPFAFWRGTIKFRLEIVCSKFHRGKFLIRYEPNLEQYALIELDSTLNKQYTKVIDIQETQDVEFCVKYAQPYSWCTTIKAPLTSQLYGSAISITNLGQTITNGFISIRPFTTLQSPDLSDISVNVYVSGEDMQVNFLTGSKFPGKRIFITESSSGISPEVGYTCFDLNEVSDTGDGCTELCFGEQPLSFRTCLKRYFALEQSVYTLGATAHKDLSWDRDVIPRPVPDFNTTASTSITLLSYLQFAFLGIKGGMRYRYHIWVQGKPQEAGQPIIIAFKSPTSSNVSTFTPATHTTPTEINVGGGAIFDPHTNAGVEVELPFYSANLFHFAFSKNWDGIFGSSNGILLNTWLRQYMISINNDAVSTDVVLSSEQSVAEDFQLLRFNGAPFYTV